MTINKKDLMNTYIVNDNGTLLYLYMATCSSVGFHKFGEFDYDFYKEHQYIVCNTYSEPSEEGVLQGHDSVDNSLRELSWEDLIEMQLCGDAVKEDVEETTEWKNGDECIYQGENWNFVSILSEDFHGTAVLFNTNTEELKQVPIISLSKPETPAQKEERKRLETVKDMFSYWSEDEGDFVAGDANDRQVVSLLFALYDAGYKKEN